MIYITRKESFSAAHKLSRPDWTEAKNNEVFGKCSNPNWHGHNYTLWVTVKGEVNPDTGFVVNLSEVSEIIKKYILEKVDHRNLNSDVDFMLGKLSSTEVLAIEFWKQIVNPINSLGCELHSVKIQETEKNFVEYFGV
ncbi:MAG TPA: 6-carboxytetrahydropterin synthase [Bacteroidia bacterium]|nr:6-carboxytetrahydropterin synthase [Bacteroidota bacterium]MBK7431515.1 6-carboxytetrahydropterin synthase [Bacteroidota bacterium]MBK7570196.1 6-carboxytetrahydropterin synthase [Bacteroidota bacterium]MBP9789737.1 6-carboxytetrahydropterin synthase [Bacteroidia bacterium]HQW23374.1 6-carboxytetrahydropterin synthase [Bacteroidia bacterium]